MRDKKLRRAFVALCQHLNVKKVSWYYDLFGYGVGEEFVHESYYDMPCKIARKEDVDKVQKQLDEMQETIDKLSKKKVGKKE